MRNERYILVGMLALAVACKQTRSEDGRTMESAPSAAPTAPTVFRLSGEFFELPLPAGWRAHPEQQKMDEFAAVSDHHELIVATQLVDLAKAQENGVPFEEVLLRLAETRRKVSIGYAADAQHVEPTQSQMLGDVPTLAFRARLSRAPLAGVTQLTLIIAVPGVRAGASSKRPVLTISLYDYDGGSPDALFTFARELLKPLQLKASVEHD